MDAPSSSRRQAIGRAATGCFGFLLLAAQLSAGQTAAAGPAPLLVAAALSLTEPLQALAPVFARRQKLPPPTFSFGSSGTLQQQIENGAPVDVFVSAGEKQMNQLEKRGLLLAGTRRVIAGNQLVLVVPARSPRRPLSFQGLGSSTVRRIAIGDSTVPAGDYARQTLAFYGLSDAVKARLVPLGSVRAVAQAVASGDVDAGIVYRSDVRNVDNLRITAAAPERSHAPIVYSAAVVRTTRQPGPARAFVLYLTTPQAAEVLRSHGLLVRPIPAATAGVPR
mgnify:CR=1 FL=1